MEPYEREIHLSRELIAAQGRYAAEKDYLCPTPGVRISRNAPGPAVENLAAAIIRLYPGSVLCGWTAARLHGHMMATSRERVELLGPQQIRRRGVISRTAGFEPDEVVERFGLPCTSGLRTAIDLARYVPGDEAIAAMDQCLRVHGRPATASRAGWVSRPAMTARAAIEAELDRRAWWRGNRVRAILAEADGRSQSPWETFSRLTLHRVGLTGFVPQVPVLDGTYFLDLADVKHKVGVEYDGAHHRDAKQHERDVERWNTLQRDLGWKLIVVTAGPLMNRPDALLRRVRSAMLDHGADIATAG